MKLLIFILCFVGLVYPISSFTYYWTINTTGDTATVVKWKANNDSVSAFATRIVDTINIGIPRWKGFSNHDSTFKWMNIDTLPSVDTAFIKYLKMTTGTATGTVTVDSFCVTKKVKSAGINSSGDIAGTTGTYSSTVSVDSLASTKGIKATRFTGAVTGTVTGTADSAIGAYQLTGGAVSATTGVFSSTLTGDSIISTKGIKATTGMFTNLTDGYMPYHVSDAAGQANGPLRTDGSKIGLGQAPGTMILEITGDQSNTGSIFLGKNICINTTRTESDSYICGDSDYNVFYVDASENRVGIGKNNPTEKLDVVGNAIVSGTVSVDSLASTKGVKATTGTFSGTVSVDSFACTKGIKATTGMFTNLTDGYIPYHKTDALGQANGPIYTNGTNISIGNTALSEVLDITGNIKASGTLALGVGAADAVNSSVILNAGSTTGNSYIGFQRGSVLKSAVGVQGNTGVFITGAIADDLILNSIQKIVFSADNGSTAGASLTTTGLKILGSGNATEALDVTGNIKASGTGLFSGTVSVDSFACTKGVKVGGPVLEQGTYGQIYNYDPTILSITKNAVTILAIFSATGGTNGLSSNVACDKDNNKITLIKAGKYHVTGFVYFRSTSDSTWTINKLGLYYDGSATTSLCWDVPEPGDDGEKHFFFIDFYLASAANKEIDLRIEETGNAQSVEVTIDMACLSVKYVGE